MCVMVVKPQRVRLHESDIRDMFRANPDGAGIVFWDGRPGRYEVVKGLMYVDDVLQVCRDLGNRQYFLHFRKATHGKVCAENTHPFGLTPDIEKSKAADASALLMHNGILTSFGSRKDDISDSMDFATSVLAHVPTFDARVKLLTEMGTGDKFLLLDADVNGKPMYQICGHWSTYKGLDVSNQCFTTGSGRVWYPARRDDDSSESMPLGETYFRSQAAGPNFGKWGYWDTTRGEFVVDEQENDRWKRQDAWLKARAAEEQKKKTESTNTTNGQSTITMPTSTANQTTCNNGAIVTGPPPLIIGTDGVGMRVYDKFDPPLDACERKRIAFGLLYLWSGFYNKWILAGREMVPKRGGAPLTTTEEMMMDDLIEAARFDGSASKLSRKERRKIRHLQSVNGTGRTTGNA